jgi:tetratricopeptide (TPR) repeat protein
VWVASIALVVLAACGGALADGKSAFKKGRYAEARETFERLEADARDMSEGRRAEYALYRGLTHGALGDRAKALVWLHEAKVVEDAHPGTLSADDLARLRLALDSYGADTGARAR